MECFISTSFFLHLILMHGSSIRSGLSPADFRTRNKKYDDEESRASFLFLGNFQNLRFKFFET